MIFLPGKLIPRHQYVFHSNQFFHGASIPEPDPDDVVSTQFLPCYLGVQFILNFKENFSVVPIPFLLLIQETLEEKFPNIQPLAMTFMKVK